MHRGYSADLPASSEWWLELRTATNLPEGDQLVIISHIYVDEHGESHFADLELSESIMPSAPGLPDMLSTASMEATSLRLISTKPDAMASGWHPAPGRQFSLMLKGSVAVEVSDGEIRQFGSGSVLFFEDTWGKGHLNHAIDTDDILLGFVAVPDHTIVVDGEIAR